MVLGVRGVSEGLGDAIFLPPRSAELGVGIPNSGLVGGVSTGKGVGRLVVGSEETVEPEELPTVGWRCVWWRGCVMLVLEVAVSLGVNIEG